MKKKPVALFIILIIIFAFFAGCLDLSSISNKSKPVDSDGDGTIDTKDAFPNDPNEWMDTDGDGYGDNSDAFPNNPEEFKDSDGDKVGDKRDVFPYDPNEWYDTDKDGYGDNSDKNPNVNLSFSISLKKFMVTNYVDLLPRAQIYFEIYINNELYDSLDDNGDYWRIWLNDETTIDYSFSFDIPDDTEDEYTSISIVMYDDDFFGFREIVDISNSPGEKNLVIKYDHINNQVNINDVSQGKNGIIWFNIDLPKEIKSENVLTRSYNWRFKNKVFRFSIDIPEKTYNLYKDSNVNRMPQSISNDAMKSFVTIEEKVIENIANTLNNLATEQGFNTVETVNFILRFVQLNINYQDDKLSKNKEEYWRYPVETLVDKRGDCEDTSVLFGSIMKILGYDTVLLFYILDDVNGHLAIGVNVPGDNGHFVLKDGKKYFYCETTSVNNMGIKPVDIPLSPKIIIKI